MEITCCFKEIISAGNSFRCGRGPYKARFMWSPLPHPARIGKEMQEKLVKLFLSPAEQVYYLRFYRNKQRQFQFLWVRVVAKIMLRHYLNEHCVHGTISLPDIELRNLAKGEQKGKPVAFIVHNKAEFAVSLTHCDEFAGAAIGLECKVGIDIETLRFFDDAFLERVFHTEERKAINLSFPELDFIRKTTLFWAAKEAIGKAVGVGLYHGFNSILIEPLDGYNRFKIVLDKKIEKYFNDNTILMEIYFYFRGNSCFVFCVMGNGVFTA